MVELINAIHILNESILSLTIRIEALEKEVYPCKSCHGSGVIECGDASRMYCACKDVNKGGATTNITNITNTSDGDA